MMRAPSQPDDRIGTAANESTSGLQGGLALEFERELEGAKVEGAPKTVRNVAAFDGLDDGETQLEEVEFDRHGELP